MYLSPPRKSGASAKIQKKPAAERAKGVGSPPAKEIVRPPAGSDEEALARRLQAILAGGGMPDEGEFAQLKEELVAFALNSLGQLRDRSETAGEYERRIELLQRRLEKVSHSLESTEQELRRVVATTDMDGGLESIYRSVQGLETSANQGELKKELMRSIFEANLELKKHMEGGGAQ